MPAPKDFIDAQVFSRGPTIVMRWSGERGWPAIFATPNCKEIFGVSAEDLVSGRRPYRDLVHPDDRRRVGLAIIETLKSDRDQIRHQDYRIVRPDGGIRYVQDFTVVQRRPDGWAEHFVGYIVDVTDRVQAAEQMRLSEERLKDFVESMSDWVWEQDADLRFTMVSTPGYQMLGRDIKGLLGKRREDLTDLEADPAEFRMHLADLAARRAFHDFRYKVHAPDGRVRHVSISGKPYFGPDGAFQGYRGVGRDISLQVEAENEKERLNRRMADAIESFSQPFILFDAEDRVVLANSRYCALVGVKEVRPGTPFLELLRTTTGAQQFARDADNSAAYIRQRLADHHAPRPPFEVELADGTWLLIIEQKTGDGGTASIFADITPLKRRHTELECQARLLQAAVTAGSEVELAEHALDAIAELQRFGAELKGGILLALDHPGARVELIAQRGLEGRFVGDSATAADGAYPCLCGRPVEFASPIHGVMPQEMHYAIPLARGRQAIGALVLYAAPGRRHLEENVAFLRTLADILGLGFDGCRRRRELLNARDMAQAANRSKSDFLAHVSHELRTPLNAIIGFSEIIAAQTFGPIGQARYLDYVHDILMSGRHLLSVVNDILDLSRIEAGRFTLHETDDMVDRLVQSTVRVMRQRVADAHLAFETTVAENLPPYRCDGIKIKQILLNLLSNAVKFTARGGRVSLAVRRAENGDLVMIVSDSGIGMRREDIPVAFEAFRQIDNAFVRRVEGTGLGLPLTRALAALHGGSLEIESEPGLGTTATVRLPARRFMAL